MLNKASLSVIMVSLLASVAAEASEPQDAAEPSSNCWARAGTYYSIDPWLLYSIAQQESRLNPRALNVNADGTYDIGLMQINSSHLPALAKFGFTEQSLWDPCTNIHVGAWVLRQGMAVFGNNWRAVGAYNAGTKRDARQESKRENYALSVYKRYNANQRLPQLASTESAK